MLLEFFPFAVSPGGSAGFWHSRGVIFHRYSLISYEEITPNRKSRVLHTKAGWSYLPFTVQLGTVPYVCLFHVSSPEIYNVILFFIFICYVAFEINACSVFSESSRSISKRANQIDLITDIVKGSFLMECAVIAAANSRFSLRLLFKENMHVLRMSYRIKHNKPNNKQVIGGKALLYENSLYKTTGASETAFLPLYDKIIRKQTFRVLVVYFKCSGGRRE